MGSNPIKRSFSTVSRLTVGVINLPIKTISVCSQEEKNLAEFRGSIPIDHEHSKLRDGGSECWWFFLLRHSTF